MKKMSRRRFLAAASAVAAAASASALVGCGERAGGPRADSNPAAVPSLEPVVTRGGVLRVYNFDAMIPDALDPHLTQMGPVVNMHSAVFNRLYRYEDERTGVIAPDLAESMPEQPDGTTYIIKLRDNIRFHDAPKYRLAYPTVAGRQLTAGDVQYSIERQIDRSSPQTRRFFRQGDWSVIDRIEARDDRTVVITTKSPVAPFVSFLAGRHAFIIAKEVVDDTDQANADLAMLGTGPFMLDSWQPGVVMRLRKNLQWFARDDSPAGAGGGRPYLDGYDAFYSPQEDTFQRIAFERRIVDATGFVDAGALDQERRTNLADIVMEETDAGGMLASRLLLDRAPFRDDRVRRAIHLAVDRRSLSDLLYPEMDGRPSGRPSGPIAPVMDRWALSADDLHRRPGYRDDSAGRAEDIAAARQLLAAALGDAPIGDVKVLFSGVPRSLPERAVAAVQRQLQENLGINVVAQVDPSGYALIALALGRNIDGATEGVTTFTFGFEDGGVDLDDWLYPHFRSGQPLNTYRLQDPQLDAMLDRTRAEFDNDARRRLGLDIQDYLLAKVNAQIEYLAPVERRLIWGYVRNRHTPIWYGSNQDLANTWLDTTHSAWRPRPE